MNTPLNLVHIDDDHEFSEWVREQISKKHGEHEVISLSSYHELSEWIEQAVAQPTIFIVNLRMDGDEHSGIECISLLNHSKFAGISFIVLMSQSTRSRDVQLAYDAGANLYMPKRADVMRSMNSIDQLLNLFENGYLVQPTVSDPSASGARTESTSVPNGGKWSAIGASSNMGQLLNQALVEPQIITSQNGTEVLVLDKSELVRIRSDNGVLNELAIPIRLVSESVSSLIDQQKEIVRGKNSLSTQARKEALDALERLQVLVKEAENLPTDPEKGSEFAESWAARFTAEVEENITITFGPENIAKATIPAAIILSCGALGAMIAGPLGFGAGSVFGHLVTGQMKPGAATDKAADLITDDTALQ